MCFCFGSEVQAQRPDSLLVKYNTYYYYADDPFDLHTIDTGVEHLQYYNFLQSNKRFEYEHLGNSGLPHLPNIFEYDPRMGFETGYRIFERYRIRPENIRYYQVRKPFSQIAYVLGLKREFLFSGDHAQNIGRQFSYGVHFHRIRSDGYYQRQISLDNSFNLYSQFHSKDEKYRFQIDLIYNRFQVQENGGVAFDFIGMDTSFIRKDLIPINIEDGEHDSRDVYFYLTNSYDFGLDYEVEINDSTKVPKFLPKFRLQHKFGIGRDIQRFDDNDPDSSYWGDFYISEDSLDYLLQFRTISNEVKMIFMGTKGKECREYRRE